MADREDQIVLKKRARRRLVGAIALVTFVVIVLPMVFDKEPKPISRDISIQIPNPDAGAFQNKVVPVPPPAALPVAAPAGVAPAAPSPAPAAKPEAIPVAKPAAKEETKPAGEGPLKPGAKAVASPVAKTAAKLEPTVPDPKAVKAETQGTGAPAGSWVVKLGAFADKENVSRLRARLAAAGIQSYAEPTESTQGQRTRVRAGPFASRAAAEKAQEKLKKMGVSGTVDGK